MKADIFKIFWKQRRLQLFVLMGMAFLFVFNYLPIFGIIMAFKNYKLSSGVLGIFTSPFVGLKNFKEFFGDYKFPFLLRNTLVLSVAKLVFTFPLPIFLAIVLNEVRNAKVKRVVQTVSYLPYFISWVIVSGFCQIFLSMNGVFNDLFAAMGWQRMQLLTGSQFFRIIAVFTAMWKETGWWTIIFLAAITGIDTSQYESAQIDGATRLQRIAYITMPGILPTITVVLILALGNLIGGGLSGSNFEQSYLLGNTGNLDVSEIIQTYVLEIGLSQGRYAYATAAGLFQSIISFTLVLVSNFVAKRISGEGLF
ncbi:MAG: ABC transporter permease subunit [Clostridiales bacterium]|nr:ABC transporter permease subunit [Clostridiales bacterium]